MKKDNIKKKFDYSRATFIKLAFKISYIGHNYHGMEVQPSINETIENQLSDAFSKVCLTPNMLVR